MLLALWPSIMWPPKDGVNTIEYFVVLETPEQIVLKDSEEITLIKEQI